MTSNSREDSRSLLESIERIRQAFSSEPRPEHFTNYTHCDECSKHDETLRRHTRDNIGMEQLGNPAWDPICFTTAEGYRYYFPAFSRLVFESNGSYLDAFLFFLRPECSSTFTTDQKAAVREFLTAIDRKYAISQGDSPTTYLMQTVREQFGLPPIGDFDRPEGARPPVIYEGLVLLPSDCAVDLAHAANLLQKKLPSMRVFHGTDSVSVSDQGWVINAYLAQGSHIEYESGQIVSVFGAAHPNAEQLARSTRRFEVRSDPDPGRERYGDFLAALEALASFPGAAAFGFREAEFLEFPSHDASFGDA